MVLRLPAYRTEARGLVAYSEAFGAVTQASDDRLTGTVAACPTTRRPIPMIFP
jgi:hypothetical protein